MRILSDRVSWLIDSQFPLRLNLGGGPGRYQDYLNVNLRPLANVDILADLNYPLDLLPDDSAAAIYSSHTLEHIDNLFVVMGEIHRLLRVGTACELIVPHFSNPYFFSDPTHVRSFGIYTMCYFCDELLQPFGRKVISYYVPFRFTLERVELRFMDHGKGDRLVRRMVSRLANKSYEWLDRYERWFSPLVFADEARFVLKPVKRVGSGKSN